MNVAHNLLFRAHDLTADDSLEARIRDPRLGRDVPVVNRKSLLWYTLQVPRMPVA